VIELVHREPRSLPTIMALLWEKLPNREVHTRLSDTFQQPTCLGNESDTLTKNKRNIDPFDAAHIEIQELKEQHNHYELELWGWYETGFVGQPSVPEAKQLESETIEVPSSHSLQRLNVLGFLTEEYQFESCHEEGTINTDVVTACFDKFARVKTEKTERSHYR